MILRQSLSKLIIQIFVIQLFVIFALGLMNIIDHSTMFYTKFTHSQFVSFGIFSLLVSICVFLFSITYSILSWSNNSTIVGRSKITIKHGYFTKSKIDVDFKDIYKLDCEIPFLGKLFNFGTILLFTKEKDNQTRILKINSVADVPDVLKMLGDFKKKLNENELKIDVNNIKELLTQGESATVEFKSTIRWDRKLNKVNKLLEKSILKTIVGFMNAKGGVLIVGVDDNGEVLGLADDYNSLPKGNIDGLENHLTQIFNKNIGIEHRHLVKISTIDVDSNEVLIIRVLASKVPIYLGDNESEEFYLRTGNTTSLLNGRKIFNYLKLSHKI